MFIRFLYLLFVLNVTCLLLFSQEEIAFCVQQRPLSSIENQEYFISLIGMKEPLCCPGEMEFALSITNKQTQRSETMTVRGRMAAFHELVVTEPAKLVVVGELRYGGNALLIVDVAEEKLQDIIWTYGYTFSPSKRLLVYWTHYPRMGLPETRRSILLLYDLTKSAAENRLPPSTHQTPEAGGFIPDNAPGIPIFPETNVAKKSYVVNLEEEHIRLSPVLWAEDEKTIVFIEFYQEQNFLVAINLRVGVRKPLIARRRIAIEEVVKKNLTKDEERRMHERLSEGPYKLAVDEIRWENPETVRVQLASPESWLEETIALPLPKLLPQ